MTLVVSGWLAISTSFGIWLWPAALALLVASCATSKTWLGIALRIGVAVLVFVAFPLVVNFAVFVLDFLGVVDRDSGGSEPAR